jgi:hypothetical protein
MVHYKIKNSNIVSDIVDQEAIIMDLNSGIYFSSQDVGAVIWDGIVCGFEEYQIKQRIRQSFSVEPVVFDREFGDFIGGLISNNLIAIDPSESAPTTEWTMPLPTAKCPYSPPILHRHGDMQDLALLDPIHDVEGEGWPNRKTNF